MKRLWRSGWIAGAAMLAGGALPVTAASQAIYRGRVTATTGQPVAAASVVIAELGIGTQVDANGSYTLTVPAGRATGQSATLRARAIGYKPMTRPVTLTSGTHTHDFALERDPIMLEAVVTTGVATATEQIKVPFAVTRVDTTLMPVQGASIANQIQGKVPGALVVSGSGRPGTAPNIVLRGPVSLNATGRSQGPLYLVDGLPINGSIPDINPADIENVEVLKGAAAASLYGARAGAGVIAITTKSGANAAQGMRFGLRTEIGAGDIERDYGHSRYHTLAMDPTGTYFCAAAAVGGTPCGRYIDWDTEIRRVNNSGQDYALPTQSFLRDIGLALPPSYDMLSGTFQVNQWPRMRNPSGGAITPSAYANSNFDMRGRINNTGVFASFGNSVQQGAVEHLDGYRRNSFRLNVDHTFSPSLSTTLQSFFSQSREDGLNLDETSGGVWFNLTRSPMMSDVNMVDNRGRIIIRHNPLGVGNANPNPVYSALYDRRVDRGTRFVGGASLRYTPLQWINLDAQFGYDRGTGTTLAYRDRGYRANSSAPATHAGFNSQGSSDAEQYTVTAAATATRTFFNDLNAIFSTRYQFSDVTTRSIGLSGTSFVVAGLVEDADAVTQNFSIGSARTTVRDAGYYVSADLDWKDRYVLNALLRRDGSSLFGAGNRWQTFGRLSAAWIPSREPWWFAPEALSLVKLRATRGSTGQRPPFSAQYETFTIGAGGTLNPAQTGNRNLKPEINTETELGLDAELFNRIGLQVTYAHAVIDGQILPVRPTVQTGFQSQWQNAGEVTNRTWEASLTVPIVTRGAFTWTSRVIYDRTRSRITRLDVPPFVGQIQPGPTNAFDIFQFREGEEIGTVYGYDFVLNCSQLPAGFQGQCSMNPDDLNAAYRPNPDGYIAWVGAGNTFQQGITHNLWRARTGLGNGPWGNNANWGMPITLRDSTSAIAYVPLGNGIPRYSLGLSQTLDYKRLNVYGLLDGRFGHKMWDIANMWSLGDFTSRDVDQHGKPVEEAKPIGYYWRRGPSTSPGQNAGIGGLYDALQPTRYSFTDAGYLKLRELQVTYRIGRVAGAGDWKVGLVGRNLHTWTKYTGTDPETGLSGVNNVGAAGGPLNSAALTPVGGYRFPNLRTFTLQLSSTF